MQLGTKPTGSSRKGELQEQLTNKSSLLVVQTAGRSRGGSNWLRSTQAAAAMMMEKVVMAKQVRMLPQVPVRSHSSSRGVQSRAASRPDQGLVPSRGKARVALKTLQYRMGNHLI
jgi:hypothetical protein